MPTYDFSGSNPPFKNWPWSEKRNVILTDKGYVRRIVKPGRVIDEILVASDHTTVQKAANTAPKIVEVFADKASYTTNTAGIITVVYNQPVKFAGGSGNVALAISNTNAGAATTAVAAANNSLVSGGNNMLSFTFTTGPAGTYKINPQTLTNATAAAVNITSKNVSNATANLQIVTAAIGANTTFTVA